MKKLRNFISKKMKPVNNFLENNPAIATFLLFVSWIAGTLTLFCCVIAVAFSPVVSESPFAYAPSPKDYVIFIGAIIVGIILFFQFVIMACKASSGEYFNYGN